MKKPHPCGTNEWEIVRVGAEIKIKCKNCGRSIMMPRIDGYKVLQSIRDAERKLGIPRISRCKVVMISALDEDFDATYASNDYDDYICKPIDIVKFDNIIKKLGLLD